MFTDGESTKLSPFSSSRCTGASTPVFVHVWEPGERIYQAAVPTRSYVADPTSMEALDELAQITGAAHATRRRRRQRPHAAREPSAERGTQTHIDAYARIALAPWFILGGVVPLAFLLWRRNA